MRLGDRWVKWGVCAGSTGRVGKGHRPYPTQREFNADCWMRWARFALPTLRDYLIIGEAAQNIPADIQTSAPDISWHVIGDMRKQFQAHLSRIRSLLGLLQAAIAQRSTPPL